MTRQETDDIRAEIERLNPQPWARPYQPTVFFVGEELFNAETLAYGVEIRRADVVTAANYGGVISCFTLNHWEQFRDDLAIPSIEGLVDAFSRARSVAGDRVGYADLGYEVRHRAMLLLHRDYADTIERALKDVPGLEVKPAVMECQKCFEVVCTAVQGKGSRRTAIAKCVVEALKFHKFPAAVQYRAPSRLP